LVNRVAARQFRRLATLGVVALALLVAACGLKGPLDPPPASAPPPQAQVDGQPAAAPAEAETPVAARRQRIFLDWLLD